MAENALTKHGIDFVLFINQEIAMMKNLKKLVAVVMFVGALVLGQAQGFHTSTTKIELEAGSLNLISKFFTADLEKAVGASVGSKEIFDEKINQYVQSKLNVTVNGKKTNLTYIGFQTNDKSTRIYFKINEVGTVQEIEVTNAMLIDHYSDQQNLVTFDINGVRKSFTAKKGEESGKVVL